MTYVNISLNRNENPLVPNFLSTLAHLPINRYPDSTASGVRSALADHHGLIPAQFFVGPGSDAILMHIGQTFLKPGDAAVVPTPSYSGFADSASTRFAKVVFWQLTEEFEYDVDRLDSCLKERPRLVFLCHPNNPTGSVVSLYQLDKIAELTSATGALLVVDEAYAEFAEDPSYVSALSLVKRDLDVLVLRTFSKFYGLAGLRIGYAAGPTHLVAALEETARPFRVNTVAQQAAVLALQDRAFHTRTLSEINQSRQELSRQLREAGFAIRAGPTNFLLVRVGHGARCAAALASMGIDVLPLRQPGMDEYIRISLGSVEDVSHVVSALVHVTASLGADVHD